MLAWCYRIGGPTYVDDDDQTQGITASDSRLLSHTAFRVPKHRATRWRLCDRHGERLDGHTRLDRAGKHFIEKRRPACHQRRAHVYLHETIRGVRSAGGRSAIASFNVSLSFLSLLAYQRITYTHLQLFTGETMDGQDRR